MYVAWLFLNNLQCIKIIAMIFRLRKTIQKFLRAGRACVRAVPCRDGVLTLTYIQNKIVVGFAAGRLRRAGSCRAEPSEARPRCLSRFGGEGF